MDGATLQLPVLCLHQHKFKRVSAQLGDVENSTCPQSGASTAEENAFQGKRI